MEVVKLIVTYGLTLSVFAGLDYLWVGVLMKHRYQSAIGHLLAGQFAMPAIVAFYIIFTLGLSFFAISPGFIKGSFMTALILGGLFGFFTYATYDLTNMGTLRSWPLSITLLDIAWGVCVSACTAAIGLAVARALV